MVPVKVRPIGIVVLVGLAAAAAMVAAAVTMGAAPSESIPRWSVVPGPDNVSGLYGLNSVSCVSATSCQAVGLYQSHPGAAVRSVAESWNGTRWSMVLHPGNHSGVHGLNSVSCVSAHWCMAVGPGGIESWNGHTWSLVANPYPQGFYSVSCIAITFCKAVGGGAIASWNGTTWASASVSGVLQGVSCVSANSCTAVGYRLDPPQTLVESWNGSTWSSIRSPNKGTGPNYLNSVSCVSMRWCTAVGYFTAGRDGTLVESWNGTAWAIVDSPSEGMGSSNNTLAGVSCVSDTSCEAVGAYTGPQGAQTLIESWNGTRWSVRSSPDPGPSANLNSVACVLATSCTAVGMYFPAPNADVLARTLVESDL